MPQVSCLTSPKYARTGERQGLFTVLLRCETVLLVAASPELDHHDAGAGHPAAAAVEGTGRASPPLLRLLRPRSHTDLQTEPRRRTLDRL